MAGGIRTTISTSEIRLAQSRIETEEKNRKAAQVKRETAADSLQTYQFKILELENNFDIAGELGPLQYLSGLTGTPMDKIINILLLVIIFVFDPLAISLVVAANFAFDKAYPKREETLYGEYEVDASTLEEQAHHTDWEEYTDEEEQKAEERMNVIGQNGNEGEHYKDIEVIDPQQVKVKRVKKILQKSPSRYRVLYTDNSTGWISKKDYKENPERINYF